MLSGNVRDRDRMPRDILLEGLDVQEEVVEARDSFFGPVNRRGRARTGSIGESAVWT